MTVWVDPEDVYTGQLYRLATPPSRAYLPQDEPELAAIHVATRQALALEAAHQPECVDAYFFAAVAAWSALFPTGADLRADDVGDAAALLYHANLAKFIATGQRFNRLDPRRGLEVQHAGRRLYTPTAYHGFAWRPDDFDCLELVGDYRSGELTHLYRKSGLGLPVVVVRRRAEREQFYRPEQSFAATALLQPSGPRVAADSPLPSAGFVLKFVNPASVDAIGAADCPICLAADLTSPFARQMALAPRDWLAGFLRPQGAASEIQLTMAEPYQRGKIPLVLVHGLLSEPRFWTNIANELNARPWFRKHYQVWFYRYPTGKGLLMSAAGLRKELQAAIALSPGAVDDPAASQMVLIGHSMGGLISKLQVTWSGNDLWDEVAHQPLDEIQAQPAIREQLRENLFFAPQPRVKRVIFLGVPHQGSADAQRAVGRLMARLVKSDPELRSEYQRTIEANPGVFSPWAQRGLPTSIDLLNPHHPLLQAMGPLPVAPQVQLHSIIGIGGVTPLQGPSDGIVPVSSARHPGVMSECYVPATHTGLKNDADAQAEIERVLREHLGD